MSLSERLHRPKAEKDALGLHFLIPPQLDSCSPVNTSLSQHQHSKYSLSPINNTILLPLSEMPPTYGYVLHKLAEVSPCP